MLASTAGPAAAGEDAGRWWWDASVGLAGWSSDRGNGGSAQADTQELQLAGSLNGFIIHPRVVPFQFDMSYAFVHYQDGSDRDDERIGLGVGFELFPRSNAPSRFYYRRKLYDFSQTDELGLSPLLGIPDTTTSWGGRLRIRRGLFQGVFLGLDQWDTELLAPESEHETKSIAFADWTRGGSGWHHNLSLKRNESDFGIIGFANQDYTLNLRDWVQLSSTWRWTVTGVGIRRDSTPRDEATARAEDYRLLSQFLHQVTPRDLLDLSLRLDRTQPWLSAPINGQGVSAHYRVLPNETWEIAPFLTYDRWQSDGLSTDSPRAGISVTWRRILRKLETTLRGGGSYGTLTSSTATEDVERDSFGYRFDATLGHGDEQSLRTELELGLVHDELDLRRDPIPELPDLGLPLHSLSAQDFYRARLSVAHAWGVRTWKVWGEWTRGESSDGSQFIGLRNERQHGFLQLTAPRWSVHADVGRGTADQTGVDHQSFDFYGGLAEWRPTRRLRIRATLREERREVALAPDVDDRRVNLSATYEMGRVLFELFAQDTYQSVEGSPGWSYRTFRWAVSTRFGGWLPIVTGTRSRGVIR